MLNVLSWGLWWKICANTSFECFQNPLFINLRIRNYHQKLGSEFNGQSLLFDDDDYFYYFNIIIIIIEGDVGICFLGIHVFIYQEFIYQSIFTLNICQLFKIYPNEYKARNVHIWTTSEGKVIHNCIRNLKRCQILMINMIVFLKQTNGEAFLYFSFWKKKFRTLFVLQSKGMETKFCLPLAVLSILYTVPLCKLQKKTKTLSFKKIRLELVSKWKEIQWLNLEIVFLFSWQVI